MPPKATNTTDGTADGPTQQEVQFGFECLRNIKDGKVELAGVMAAMNYTNIDSVANRFRKLRTKYGLTGLECTTANAPTPNKRKAAADGDGDGMAPKRGPGRPPKKPRGKAAKAAAQDNDDGEDGEESQVDFAVEGLLTVTPCLPCPFE
ncbi:uncharacterized protein BDV14DRAFT_204841 [Aspergillus stella-maris]|uniref:uncharacterized protein n=1 Tax=Aspergillus stella-maris TaxID=1810926 RepID=UPI003CCCD26A